MSIAFFRSGDVVDPDRGNEPPPRGELEMIQDIPQPKERDGLAIPPSGSIGDTVNGRFEDLKAKIHVRRDVHAAATH